MIDLAGRLRGAAVARDDHEIEVHVHVEPADQVKRTGSEKRLQRAFSPPRRIFFLLRKVPTTNT